MSRRSFVGHSSVASSSGHETEHHAVHTALLEAESRRQVKQVGKGAFFVPQAPSPDEGVREVVLSPRTERMAGSPVRLNDLIQPGWSPPTHAPLLVAPDTVLMRRCARRAWGPKISNVLRPRGL